MLYKINKQNYNQPTKQEINEVHFQRRIEIFLFFLKFVLTGLQKKSKNFTEKQEIFLN